MLKSDTVKTDLARVSDEILMLKFRQGDEACFEELVNRHKQRVLNLVYRFLRGCDEAEDIAQDIFVKIYKSGNDYKPSVKFTTWLYVICRNTCYKVLSKRRLPLISSLGSGDPDITSVKRIPAVGYVSPGKIMAYNELSLAVKRAVDSLPNAQRMVFILKKYEHRSFEDIAEITNSSTSAVKSLLHRARRKLIERLRGHLE